ncbi:hypothetical protein [Hymenobacter sp. IS2118]|uniref:hypothetical protein n=1 Tax=Hymenobacter sp. IS2118 TaxID=1505605 RepID=UPI000AC0AC59|nr:hypothetical protein [Hymenobacter sp. IS2118]
MKTLTTALQILLSMCLLLPAAAQTSQTRNDEPSYATRKHITLAVTRYAEAHAALNLFIANRATKLYKKEESPEQLIADFSLSLQKLPQLDSLVATLGLVLENKLNTEDLTSREQELRVDEQRQENQLATAEAQLKKSGPDKDVADLRTEAEGYRGRLARSRQLLADLQNHTEQAYVTLRLYDEVSFPTGNRRVSFVNMPGVEYGYLRLDNPQLGKTSQAYQGYAVKYLFTRGKSYLNLGVYKPLTKSEEEGFVDELFMINFGQDFYPRNFGRGRRRYLNLYSSYQIGGVIVNQQGAKGSEFIPNLNLGLGVELLKTRHILLDTKASYFVPLHDRSRELRGLLGQASFNFVF